MSADRCRPHGTRCCQTCEATTRPGFDFKGRPIFATSDAGSTPDDREACCEHSLKWHHETRGCGYHGFSTDRCPCLLPFDDALAEHDRQVAAQALRDAAADLPIWEAGNEVIAYQWLRDRAGQIAGGES